MNQKLTAKQIKTLEAARQAIFDCEKVCPDCVYDTDAGIKAFFSKEYNRVYYVCQDCGEEFELD